MSDEANEAADADFVQYSCHPIRKLGFGRKFRFENGIMRIPASEVEEFETLLEGADARTKYQVKKIDAMAAEAVIRDLIKSGATKSIDSTAGGDFARGTQVGTTDIGAQAPVEEVKLDDSAPAAGAEKLAGPLTGGLNLSAIGK
jgi:hypothetical protein